MMGLLGTSFDDPRTMATLALAQGLLGGGGSMQRLAGGLAGYQGVMGQSKREEEERKRRALQEQMLQLQLQTAQQQQQAAQEAQKRQQAIEGAYRGAFVSPAQQALAGGGGPTQANAQRMQGMTPQFDQQRLIQGLMQADPIMAAKLAQPQETEVKEYREVRNPDGSVTVVGLTKDGKVVNTNTTPFIKPELRDFGGFVGGIDPVTLKMNRVGDKSMSPGEMDASRRGWAGLSQQQSQFNQRLAQDRERFEFDKSKGSTAGAPTGEERKAATLLQRLRGSQAQLEEALTSNPGAAKPELLPEAARRIPFIGGDTTANVMTSEPRQRVEAAQLDLLDAALTLGTGAAYTREQLEGYRRSYFPQIGDDARTVQDKRQRLQNVIRAAEIAAGRADPGLGGMVSQQPIDSNDPLGLRGR